MNILSWTILTLAFLLSIFNLCMLATLCRLYKSHSDHILATYSHIIHIYAALKDTAKWLTGVKTKHIAEPLDDVN